MLFSQYLEISEAPKQYKSTNTNHAAHLLLFFKQHLVLEA
jgi:hypothetical protein